jgi:hypothetical protein
VLDGQRQPPPGQKQKSPSHLYISVSAVMSLLLNSPVSPKKGKHAFMIDCPIAATRKESDYQYSSVPIVFFYSIRLQESCAVDLLRSNAR